MSLEYDILAAEGRNNYLNSDIYPSSTYLFHLYTILPADNATAAQDILREKLDASKYPESKICTPFCLFEYTGMEEHKNYFCNMIGIELELGENRLNEYDIHVQELEKYLNEFFPDEWQNIAMHLGESSDFSDYFSDYSE